MIFVYLNAKGKPYLMPENWNELTAKHLLEIALLLLKSDCNAVERSYIAFSLTGIQNKAYSTKQSRDKEGYNYLANEVIDKLVPTINWLFEKNKLTKQLLPEINVCDRFRFFGTCKLHGPTHAFNNLTIAEFSDTESCLTQYEATNDELWLNRFMAILYRPAKKKPAADGDIRVAYNFHQNDFIAVMVSKIDVRIKAATLLWYYGCRNELVEQNKFLFGKGKSGGGDGSFTDIIHALAGPKFGTVEETGHVLLKVALHELRLMHENNAAHA